ncbi:putative alpha beta hydrolase [Phaeomoniella chlamydospora]|uniref:Putative alpha beta hydrolase n=1 Tax=Phaeomoniella chlamydospora TaxID=158046 RepID=A0A0G2EMP7_PHACM|nr:putative alpha beta hydrolase [Phaeomoniella chlamydospora]
MSRSEAGGGAESDTGGETHGGRPMLARQREKEEARTKGEKRGGFFPLGYKEGFSQWWSSLPAAQAEHQVLSYIPYLQKPPTHTETGSAPPSTTTVNEQMNKPVDGTPMTKTTSSLEDPYGPRKWLSRMVPLSGKNRALNEFSVERVGENVENNLVILHGYGAGLGFFYKNFEGLSRAPGWQLYALDLLGMGRSSRPPFRIKSKQRPDQITEAESWFVDALEEWRIKKKLDRFTLLGHSLGGYLAVAYALKYPGRLNKLVLASPVGIPEDPYAVSADMPDPSESNLANEFTQDQERDIMEAEAPAKKPEPPRRPLPKWLTYLWDANISPFSFVRWSGPLGPRLVSGWTTRRFSHLPPDEAQALHQYSYSLFRLRGSGEYALAYILAPGAFARSPLVRRIGGVGRQPIPSPTSDTYDSVPASTPSPSQKKENGIPVVMMYGDHDWMDVKGGHAAVEKLELEKKKFLHAATDGEKARENGDAKVVIISSAGHHVYLDNPEEFNKVMMEEMKDVEKREKILKDIKDQN